MIVLPFTAPRPGDPALARGWEAEEQVAHDLGRAFADTPDVMVFNGLRFPAPRTASEGDHVQIDHLVLHRHGMVLIESKATGRDGTGEFVVDGRGQWMRCPRGDSGRKYNIESPVKQAKEQAKALRLFLNRAEPPLLDKTIGLVQQRFGEFPIRELVAIVNSARISGQGVERFARDVMKAERIADATRDEIKFHRSATGIGVLLHPLELRRGLFTLSDAALRRTAAYLAARHTPLRAPAAAGIPPRRVKPAPTPPPRPSPPVTAPPPAARPAPTGGEPFTCRHCRSINVVPVFRRDYCLVCAECSKYTPIERACTCCGRQARIRKDGQRFFRDCPSEPRGCGASVMVWSGAA